MPIQTIPVQIVVRSDADKKSNANLSVLTLPKSSRGTLALKTLAMFWGGALVSLLIPIVHFVSVPAGLMAGVFMSWRAYGFANQLEPNRVLCPNCQTEIELKPRAFNWPLREECAQCRAWLLMNPKSQMVGPST